ncbi:ScyD/ScyE family protein [Niastella caeni]|uniref:ScyD/ScyE family protein n=1 Tax=Niastella caeni TaxID=2569763 RepID=A0A4S8HK39_9BACT|nr:ScyD/ScyE family protein [Niastella caeni]THU34991.1 ScyD/ScyE family protein [Niastella caeni]
MQTSFYINHYSWVESRFFKYYGWSLLAFVLLFGSCKKDEAEPGTVTVFGSGLNNPRGLKFGPDGFLYVAEAGLGGTENHDAKCPALVPPDGPYLGSATGGRISKFSKHGTRTTVTDQLPSVTSAFGDKLGVNDVAFVGNTLYAVLYAGCGHGVPSVPTSIVRINSGTSHTVIADLGQWRVTHPVANPEPADFDPEGAWYSMISVHNDLYTLDANHGELVKVTTDGTITSVIDISASQGHVVPTAIDYRGNFYVGNLGTFPIVDGSSNIYKINPGGQISIVHTGFTTILGLVFDNRGRMYVLESTTGNPFPTPGTGRVVRVDPDGSKEVIATGFSNPTAMTYGPDGNLYVANWGFGGEAGDGEILKVRLKKNGLW